MKPVSNEIIVKKLSNDIQHIACPICLETIKNEKGIEFCFCPFSNDKHGFCLDCSEDLYFSGENKCPLCRKNLGFADIAIRVKKKYEKRKWIQVIKVVITKFVAPTACLFMIHVPAQIGISLLLRRICRPEYTFVTSVKGVWHILSSYLMLLTRQASIPLPSLHLVRLVAMLELPFLIIRHRFDSAASKKTVTQAISMLLLDLSSSVCIILSNMYLSYVLQHPTSYNPQYRLMFPFYRIQSKFLHFFSIYLCLVGRFLIPAMQPILHSFPSLMKNKQRS